jgi:ankyrin repeat protein
MKITIKHIVILCMLTIFTTAIHTGPAEDNQLLEAAYGNITGVQAALEKGANINATDKDGWTALIRAMNYNYRGVEAVKLPTVNLLLSKGADVNAKANDGRTALIFAAAHKDVELVKLLLSKGADANAKANNGQTV